MLDGPRRSCWTLVRTTMHFWVLRGTPFVTCGDAARSRRCRHLTVPYTRRTWPGSARAAATAAAPVTRRSASWPGCLRHPHRHRRGLRPHVERGDDLRTRPAVQPRGGLDHAGRPQLRLRAAGRPGRPVRGRSPGPRQDRPLRPGTARPAPLGTARRSTSAPPTDGANGHCADPRVAPDRRAVTHVIGIGDLSE